MSSEIFNFKNLIEIFVKRKFSDSKGITFIYSKYKEVFVSYRDLHDKALRVLYNLQQKGLKPGDELILLLEDNQDFVYAYWACILGGIIPVITTSGRTEEDVLMLHKVIRILKNPRLIGSRELIDNWRSVSDDYDKTLVMDEMTDDLFGMIYDAKPDDIAELMFSSGSTGEPKGIIRTHKNLLTNLSDVSEGAKMTSEDVFLGWAPLSHAFGLTGWHLIPLLLNCNQHIISKEVFVNDPMIWFEKTFEHKATLLGSPNFGYKHFLGFFDSERAKDWDLSHVRLIFNAAEPISVELCNEFLDTMGKYKLKRNTMYPFYGMTETCLMISLSPSGENFQSVCVDRRSLNVGEFVRNAVLGDENSSLFTDVGYPGLSCSLRICDDEQNVLDENIVGHIQVRGNHITPGYYCNEEATKNAFTADGWLKTGDIGFLRDGRLIIAGRAKNIIFVNGVNFFPHDIERIIREVEGVNDSQLAVCGITDKEIRGEKIVGFIVSNLSLKEFISLSLNIKKQVRRKMGLEITEIISVEEIPKTRSGKVQRYKLGQRYKNGEFDTELAKTNQYLAMENAHRKFTLPTNKAEEKLIQICQDVFVIDKISVNDKLFEISGDSLRIINLTNLINQEFNTSLKITDLFKLNTIKEIAQFLIKVDVLNEEETIENKNSSMINAVKETCVSNNKSCITSKEHFVNESDTDHDRDIAIIGMSGRFPEADNLEEFWTNLLSSKRSIKKYPNSRRKELHKILGQLSEPEYVEQGYLDYLTMFEPEIFSINKEESKYIDPQQRLLLELVEEAILDAGYNPNDLSGKEVGVYLSSNENEYAHYIESSSMFAFVNRVPASNAARIAYVYNFLGPVMSIDTACSSSLVAIHNACQNIRWGDVECAVAGGVHLRLLPPTQQEIEKNPTLSIDQELKAFAKDANGTVDGEGGGILLLKSLKKAIRDGNPIHAIIKGSAVNSNGNRSNGLNAPNENGQSDVILKAINNAQIDPLTISYIETHGTGTKIGDPIEIAGLTVALQKLGYAKKSVPVGSLKTNIGHLIGASGVANVIKMVLSLKNQTLPASINYSEPNPLIDFESSPVYVNTQPVDWKMNTVRRAGVTSLGLTGTNAHLILEEAPQIRDNSAKDYSHIITLSARTQKSLQKMIINMKKYIELHPVLKINEIAYTLNTGRRDYHNKFAIVADSTSDLLERIKDKDYCIYEEKNLKEISPDIILPDLENVNLDYLQRLYQKELNYKTYVDGLIAELENKNDLTNRKVQYLIYSYAFIKLLHIYSLNPKTISGVGLGEVVASLIQSNLPLNVCVSQMLEFDQESTLNNESKLTDFFGLFSQLENKLVILFSPNDEIIEAWHEKSQNNEQISLLCMNGDTHSFHQSIIQLMQNGLKVNWLAIYQGHGLQKINLPSYVFDRESYFVQSQRSESIINHNMQIEPVIAKNNGELTDSIEKKTYEMMKELISSEKFNLEDKFFDTGITSVAIIHFIGKVKKEFGVELHVTQFFDDITLKELLNRITDVIKADLHGNDFIKKQPDQEYYLASAAQKRVFVVNQFGNDLSYNVPIVLRGVGSFKPEKLEAAFKILIKRHESLRTSFDLIDGEVIQRIHPDVDFSVIDFKTQNIKQDHDQLIVQFIQPFDLSNAPLFRVGLIEDVDQHFLLLDFHHIISDGVSVNILLIELTRLYLDEELPEMRLQYRDFAVWQEDFLQSDTVKKQEEYWLERFQDEIPILQFPTDYPRPATRSVEGDTLIFSLNKDITAKLNHFISVQGVTLYMALMAAFNVVLAKYTGQNDLVIGSPITGRRHADLEDIFGMFVNTLAIRNSPLSDQRFDEFLKEVKVNALDAYENQDCQFEELVERLILDRDLSRNPLFDVMFAMQNANNFDIQLGDAKFSLYQFENKVTKFDLTLSAFEIDGEIKFNLEYCTKLFRKSSIQQFAQHFINIISAIIENPSLTIAEIEMISVAEKEQIIDQFNNTKHVYPEDQTITQLFEEQVERTPNNLAVVYKDQQLSYRQLNDKANQLAWILRTQGVQVDQVIGIMADPSLEMFIGVMGILKAGAAYLPIDPQYPADRIEYILADSNVQILVTQQHLINKVNFAGKIIDLADKTIYLQEKMNLPELHTASDLAYVIYTSGSTGQPKGVMIEHKSLINLVFWHNEYYQVTEADHSTKYAGFSFDASVWEIFPYLSVGASIYIVNPEIRFNVHQLNTFFEKHQISICFLPTQICEQFLNVNNGSLRMLLTGGDKLQISKQQSYQLVNNYGPTENTVVTTSFVIDATYDNIPVGQPIANTQIYILDQKDHLQPIGVAGELCISGVGLARGYINNTQLTDEKFVENPFVSGAKMYRTGDRARWLSDGTIEFLGRNDQQVKIRGFRIELGEIENQLLTHPDIEEAIVIDRVNAKGNKDLCAYLVVRNQKAEMEMYKDEADLNLSIAEIRLFLAKTLPDYMIPAYFIFLNQVPLTTNGKIDRRALLDLDVKLNVKEYIAPRTKTEEKLAKIWRELLSVEKVGIHDNFFEMGGHSLSATQLMVKVLKEFDAELPFIEIFRNKTIEKMAKYLERTVKVANLAIPVVHSNHIGSNSEQSVYPVSSAQKRLYILSDLEGENITYNMPQVLVIEGELDQERFALAFRALIKRHDSLRTSFERLEGEIVQIVHKDVNFDLECLELSEEELQSIIAGFVKPFDLCQAPLFRASLVKCGDQNLLLLDLHHIISDGVSMDIFFTEFFKLYVGESLPELRIQYKDFASWHEGFLKSEIVQKQEKYWLNVFGDPVPVLNLPTDYALTGMEQRPAEMSFEGRWIEFALDEELSTQVKNLAAEMDVTLYMILLAVFNTLLAKYSGQDDIIMGTAIAGRHYPDLENIIGMFVNTLALRNYPTSQKTFMELLADVKVNTLNAFANQDYQFDMLVDKLAISRDLTRNALFDVMFVLQNRIDLTEQVNELGFRPYPYEQKVSKFDLTLYAIDEGERLCFTLEYSTTLFKPERMENLTRHFVKIVNAVVVNPEMRLAEIEVLSSKEKEILLEEFNNTQVEYPKEKTIGQLFEEQVQRNANQIAVVFEDQKLTYRELNERANQLARNLREKGVGPDQIVGIMGDRSLETIIGVLSIVKAGGAYLPIDIDYPKSRVEYMLKDSKANLLLVVDKMINVETGPKRLVSKESLHGVQFDGEVIHIADPQYYSGNSTNLSNDNQPNDLIYIIYTSGSTGKPKGVMIEHRNVNRLISNSNMLKIDANDRILQTGSLAFDASTFEIWGALLNGASLYLIRKDDLLSAEVFESKMKTNQITMIWLTAPLFNQFFEESPMIFANLKTLFVGGDVLSPKHINSVREEYPELTVVNGYGPTESTTFATYFKIDQAYQNCIPIGKPVSNTRIYILNKNDQLQPMGVPGEICISGDGLARGYLNRSELTKEKFVANPIGLAEMIYRTGDLGRWGFDGNLEFMGRMDHQVKIRGFRIELGEIEVQLLQHEMVTEAIVLDKIDVDGEKYLLAYVVSTGEISSTELREFLSNRLPDYMIPSYIIFVDHMPLTTNGKIDRIALKQMDHGLNREVEYVAPETKDEKKMVKIWADILGVDSIGVNDNFFEIGGHSLKATQLISRVWKEFNVELSLRTIFKAKTIKGLIKQICKTEQVMFAPIKLAAQKKYYPVSSAQKRLYAIHAVDHQNLAYNMPHIMIMEGHLDLERFEMAFRDLIKRHESLRTAFVIIDGQVMQQIHEEVDFSIWKMKASELKQNDDKLKGQIEDPAINDQINKMVKEFVQPFDLTGAPLLRVGLLEVGENKHIFMLDIHHIISDGISMEILFNEFRSYYDGQKLPEKKIHYKDFAVWQNQLFQSDEIKRQEEYWLNTFTGAIPVLQLPLDEPRPAEKTIEGNSIKFTFTPEMSLKIKDFATQQGVTLYMTLLAGFNLLLARYSGQEDIVVGSPVAGRRHADVENIIGMFVNTIAMRNYPVATKTFGQFLQEVKDQSLKVLENQDYPFEMLVEQLDFERDFSRNALFDVMFVLQNATDLIIQLNDLNITPYQYDYNTSKFDLTLAAYEESQRICFNLEYCTRLFKKETMERLGRYYINMLSQAVENPDLQLTEIEMITQTDKEQLLIEFNNTTLDFPMNKTISQLFEEQVAKTPDQIAVVFDEQRLSYAELNKKSNQLARVLREKGVVPDQIIGLMVERSLDMVVGIMGILKAGGAYLPIDPDYPVERIKYMLADSDAAIVLTQNDLIDKVESKIEIMDLNNDTLYSGEQTNLACSATPNHLAYIIYTSGSTGIPKGVMIEQKAVVNLLTWFNLKYDLKKNRNVLQMTTYIFDPTVEQILGSLLHGATVHLITKNIIADQERFIRFVKENEIHIVNFVPSALKELLCNAEKIPCLQVLISGGERLEESLKDKIITKGYNLYNHYGPTETTVDALTGRCSLETKIALGRPIANMQCYIVDQQDQIVPIGVTGEICLAGVGLAKGYLNNNQLTEEKFVPNPFKILAKTNNHGARIYRTGDLGRWLPDGTIEYIGRIDDQVKIRGYRIEPGEIEKQIIDHPAVKDVVVLARTDERGNQYLCANLVADDQENSTFQQLITGVRTFLGNRLPDYMIPAYFVKFERIPVTATGKIDRNALLEVAVTIETDTEYIAPTNEVEERLASIWGDVLGVQNVGINDNFFTLGGDSIKAIQILARARQQGIHLSVKDIFKFKTISNLLREVDYIKEQNEISQAEITGNVLLTPIQKWFFSQNFAEHHYYHQSNLFSLNSTIDHKLLRRVLVKLIQHHDALRMSFKIEDGEIEQFNRENGDIEFDLPVVDLSSYEYNAQKELLRKYSEEIQSSFDLAHDLLLKAVIFDLGQQGQRLLMVIHHLIVDGVSWRILIEDLENQYRSRMSANLPSKTTSFQDWSQRLNEYVQMKKVDIEYWKKIDLAQIESLIQEEVKDNYLKDHKQLFVELDQQQTDQLLTGVNWAYNTEINDILLSALLMAVTEVFKTNNLLLNVEGHGREEILEGVDLTRTIGWFTSMYPVYLEKQESIEQTIIHVKENLKLIPEKGLNFGLASYLQNDEELQKLDPEISFNYLGQFADSFNQNSTSMNNCLASCHEKISSSLDLNNQSDYLIDLNGMIVNGQFQLSFSFNANYFTGEQLQCLQNAYTLRLQGIIEHCQSKTTRTYTASDFGVEKIISAKDFEYLLEGFDLENARMYALTPMQEGMLFHSLVNEESNNYYEQLCLTFEGDVDIEKIKMAWQEMTSRHEIFRTCFVSNPLEKPIQLILNQSLTEINYVDFSDQNSDEQRNDLEQLTANERKQRFDFAQGKVSRLVLVKLASETYFFCWTFHHILLDGWSMQIVLNDFFQMYHSLIAGKPFTGKEAPQFATYLEWLKKQDLERGRQFWTNYVQRVDEPTLMVLDQKKEHGEGISETIDSETIFDQAKTIQIEEFCKRNNITLNAFVQTAWGILLQNYHNTNQSCFGTTVSGRPVSLPEVEGIVGLFINTLPVLIQTEENTRVKEILAQVNNDLVEIREHEHVPLVEIQKIANHSGKLFDSILVFENYPVNTELEKMDLGFTIQIEETHELTNYDLVLAVGLREKLIFKLSFNADRFSSESTKRIQAHLLQIITQMLEDEERLVGEISMLTVKEQEQLLLDFNNTSTEDYNQKTIVELFEEQVQKNPDQLALAFKGQQLTYHELNTRANQLARRLRVSGVQPNQIIGIMAERSFEMIIGLLGIWKAGGAYLPLDPEYPLSRIGYLLEDSQVGLLLCTHTTRDRIIGQLPFRGEIIQLDDEKVYVGESANLDPFYKKDSLAYVIYTSGTTGTPKGVMVEHQSIGNTINWRKEEYQLGVTDIALQLISYTFDAFVTSFFTPMVSGTQIVILSEEDARDPVTIKDSIVKHKITHLVSVPALYKMILENLTGADAYSLRIVTLGGEKISPELIAKSKEINSELELINEYGPTETSVIATVNRNLLSNSSITIGKPIANTEVYIVNKSNQLMPIGIAGELCIAGKGMARGYLKRKDLTDEKFVQNPFVHEPFVSFTKGKNLDVCECGRMYKTGDLAKWLPDGSIEFLGRIDHQVKIRGYRIETGEIEAQLLRYDGIKEAVVLDQVDELGGRYLCAHIVAEDGIQKAESRDQKIEGESQAVEISSTEICDFLAQVLPSYMIPAHFILLNRIPLTSNGKIDRKSLLGLDGRMETASKYVAPETDNEQRMAKIWSEILGVEKIGVHDNFFELGGHSLKATQLVAKILKEFQVEMPLRDVFKVPTIQKMIKQLKDIQKVNYSAIPTVNKSAYYPVSSAQKRLFALKELEGEGVAYNTPSFITIKGKLVVQRLEKAFESMITRHESLRTSFVVVNDQVVQRVHENVDFSICQTKANDSNAEKISKIVKDFVQPFDLSNAPLLRVGLLKIAEDLHILMLDLHHIISDGASISIFFKELFELYDGKSLSDLRIQYKDFSVWQNKLFQSVEIQKQERFWLDAFAGEIPVLNLLTDHSPTRDGDPLGFTHRPTKKSVEGNMINFALSEELSKEVKELATQEEATLYMVLLAAFNVLLARYSGQKDIIVGSPIAGRNHPDLDQTIGMFVNTLAMRNQLVSSISFKEFLNDVKEKAIKAYENQDYPFEMLVEKLELQRDLSRNALFDVMFVFQNLNGVVLQHKDLDFTPYQYNYNISKFDLTLNAFEENNRIGFNFEYSVQLFKQETMERMIQHFIHIIQDIVNNPNQPLATIEMIRTEEKGKIVEEFNGTKVDYPVNQTVHQLFAAQVQRTREKIAISYGDQKLTYGELDSRANQVAVKLKSLGVTPNQIVGIMVEHSLEMVIGILAILKAGGAYLPIAPEYSEQRIEYMLRDSNVQVLLNPGQHRVSVIPADVEEINLTSNQLYEVEEVKNSTDLFNQDQGSDLAYVIYTSGSTGQPKGVMVEHRNIINTICWRIDEYKMAETDRVLQLLSFAFDGSVAGFFASLIAGSEFILLDEKEMKDPTQIKHIIQNREITHFICVPSLYGAILESLRSEDVRGLKIVTLGGEAVKPYLIRKTRELSNQIELVNEYGPTENSVTTTILRNLQQAKRITIGKPIANTQVYILDQNLQMVPIGVAGELCISGAGLARGYLNRPELTAEKFVQHQFGHNHFAQENRIYKTGDLGRWLPDGTIEFLGRMDQQVKIRGFRIELGEIENQLLRIEKIRKAAVIDRVNSRGEVDLCAYLVCDEELADLKIRNELAQILPDYMIPRYLIKVEKIPVTIHGKLDRKALPEVNENINREDEFIAPASEVEQVLAEIWSEILGRNQIGTNDNFFELGGDSIKAIQIVSRAIQQGFKIKTEDLFQYKTIANIINNLDGRQDTLHISQQEVEGEVLLNPVQTWFFTENFYYRHYFNQNILCLLPDDVNLQLLKKAFDKLIEHHDALRMSYQRSNEQINQYNRRTDQVEFILQYVDLSSEPYEQQKENLQKISEKIQDQLNISEDLLVRGVIFDLGKNGKRLFISVHHLVIDGVSWRILLEDLEVLYNSNLERTLPLKTTSFREWSRKLNDYARRETVDTEYWEKIDLSRIKPLVEQKVSDNYFKDYQRIGFELNEEQTEQLLTKVHWAFNTEINDILLSALTLALTESMEVENVLLTLEGHGRENVIADVDLSRTIGWFTSIYPVYFERQADIEKMIKHIKENLRRVPNKGLNFGIARYLNHNQALERINPEISFNYLGQFSNIQEKNELKNKLLTDCPEKSGLSIHPDNQHTVLMDVTGSIIDGKLQFTLSYPPAYLNDQWMDELKAKYQKSLIEVIEYCCNQTEQTNTISDYGVEDILDEDDLDFMKDLLDL